VVIKFILILLNLLVVCGSYYAVVVVPLKKGNFAEIYNLVLVLGSV
jgi:hypothetical protein